MSVAYALRAEYEDSYAGGVLAVGYDRTIDISAELENGSGQIVVADNDEALKAVLDGYPALKRVTTDSDEPTVDRYDGMSLADLRRETKNLGLEVDGNTKEAHLAALRDQAASGQEG